MLRIVVFIYGAAAYLAFLAVFLWFVAFVGDFAVPKTVNSGIGGDASRAVILDLALIALFGVSHSVMARAGFKQSLTRLIPAAMERSTYVWVSNIMLAAVILGWQPITLVAWSFHGPWQILLYGVFALGWVVMVVSTFLTDHFYLFGLKQITAYLGRRESMSAPFRVILFYKFVRHPMMLGLLISLWSVPTMTVGGLLLAGGMSAYILIGTLLEEQGLEEELGADYQAYKQNTPMLLPLRFGRKAAAGQNPAD